MNRHFDRRPVPARRQRGATLVVVLILLLVMTLLGLASLRGTVLEERMTSSLLDRSLAFQSAETALREAEAVLAPGPAFPAAGCVAGLCARPDPALPERWLDPAFNGWRAATSNQEAKVGQPEWFVEAMGQGPNWALCDTEIPVSPNCLKDRFRISARSNAANGRAAILLQTTYAAF